jgi:hypothetical protein
MRRWGFGICWTLLLTSSAHADNATNDYLLASPADVQSSKLGAAVGEDCHAQSPFYMGISKSGTSTDSAFWSIKCSDGRAFVVEVHPDGSSRFVACAVYEGAHIGTCFQKLPGD